MAKGFDGSVETDVDRIPLLAEMQRHVKRILSDLPWHLALPLALAGGGTYTVGDYRQRQGVRRSWMRTNCARSKRP
jgi:hypothetical protein